MGSWAGEQNQKRNLNYVQQQQSPESLADHRRLRKPTITVSGGGGEKQMDIIYREVMHLREKMWKNNTNRRLEVLLSNKAVVYCFSFSYLRGLFISFSRDELAEVLPQSVSLQHLCVHQKTTSQWGKARLQERQETPPDFVFVYRSTAFCVCLCANEQVWLFSHQQDVSLWFSDHHLLLHLLLLLLLCPSSPFILGIITSVCQNRIC